MDNYIELKAQIQDKLSKIVIQFQKWGHKDLIDLINICATGLHDEDIPLENLADTLMIIIEEAEEREILKNQAFNCSAGGKKYYIWKATEEKPYKFLGVSEISDAIINTFEPFADGYYFRKINPNNPERSEHFFALPETAIADLSRGVPKALAEKHEKTVVCPKCKAIMRTKVPCAKCGHFLIEGPQD